MKLNHKYRLIPTSGNAAEDARQHLNNLLDDNMNDSIKMALYEDLLARIKNFKAESDVPINVQLVTESRTDLSPSKQPVDKLSALLPTVKQTSDGEMVLNGNVIPGTNLGRILAYAFKKTKVEPPGYAEFYAHSKDYTGIQPPHLIETPPTIAVESPRQRNEPQTTPSTQDTPTRVVTPRRGAREEPPLVFKTPEETTKRASKPPVRFSPYSDFIKFTPKTRQKGKGHVLNVKMWRL